MKVSYLIVAHNNLKHLERLIEQLNNGENGIYIHLDARCAIPSHLLQIPNVHFLPHRIEVYWGGYSQCLATLNLMEYAQTSGADYFALISGTDYPVRKLAELNDYLTQGGEFINLLPIKGVKPMHRYLYFYAETPHRRNFLRPATLLLYVKEYVSGALKAKKKIPFNLYAGSNWFILSNNCVNYILHTMQNDLRYRDFFKNTLCSDESLFHTIIGNSPFLKEVKYNLTYTDWNTRNPPALIKPKHVSILKNNDTFSGIYGTFKPFFARKFDDSSAEVVELIKSELINR